MKDKFFSRKLLVFIIGTIILLFDFISEQTWLVLACIYVGIQGAQDAIGAINSMRTVGPRPPKPPKTEDNGRD